MPTPNIFDNLDSEVVVPRKRQVPDIFADIPEEQEDASQPSLVSRAISNLIPGADASTLDRNVEDFGQTLLAGAESAYQGISQWMAESQAKENAIYGTGGADVDDASLRQEAQLTQARQRRLQSEGQEAAQRRAAADIVASDIQGEYPEGRAGYQAMGIARSIPTMAAAVAARSPTVGSGLIGMITAGQQRSQALQEGYSEDRAEISGLVQGSIEGSFDALTLGISKYGFAPFRDALTRRLGKSAALELMSKLTSNSAGRVAAAATEGGLTEGLTTAAQMASDEAILGKDYTSGDYVRGLRDSVIQGGAIGSGVYVAGKPGRMQAERVVNEAKTEEGLKKVLENYDTAKQAGVRRANVRAEPENLVTKDIFEAEADLQAQEAEAAKQQKIDKALSEREAQAAEQKRIEEEAGFQTIEREAPFRGRTRLEEYAGVTERTPINPPAEVTPEDVVAQEEQARLQEAERQNRSELGQLTEQLRKRQTRAQKAQLAEQTKVEKANKTADTKRRNQMMDELIAQNPEATPDELAPLLRRRLQAPTPVAEEAQAAPAAAPVQPQAVSTQASPIPAPTKTDKSLADKEVDDIASKLGVSLGMAADSKAPADTEFRTKAKQLVGNLVKRNKQDSNDVQTLIHQGKLVIAPNPKSIGRDELNNQAEYDPATNKMYLYTDRVNTKNVVPALAATLHESTHAGQFNDRQGRPDIFKQMMSPTGISKASDTIRVAARNGNKMAQAAVQKAQAASPDQNVRDLELVPYFVSEAVAARGKSLGQLRGTANDITRSAVNFIKKSLGVELDVTLGDLDQAAQQVAGEISATDLSERREGEALPMIAGPSATSFPEAQKAGRTYRGRVDQGERFEVPDIDAEVTDDPETIQDLLDGTKLPLGEVLSHPELYNEYPELVNKYDVKVDRTLGGTSTYGSFDRANNILSINPVLLSDPEKLRSVLLHEIQHAIQAIEGFVPGANWQYFIPRSIANRAEAASKALDDAINAFDYDRAVNSLPANVKKSYDAGQSFLGIDNKKSRAQDFLDNNFFVDSNDRLIQAYGRKYQKIKDEFTKARDNYLRAERDAFDIYLRDYGETEARNTQFRSRMLPATLANRPPESTMSAAPGEVSVGRTLDTRSLKVLGMAAEQPLYRETNAGGAISLLEGMSSSVTGPSGFGSNKVFASFDPTLALGQGDNQGIMVKLDPSGFDITRSISKPADTFLQSQDSGEVQITPARTERGFKDSGKFVQSITLKPGWNKGDHVNRDYADRLMLRMRQWQWPRIENTDGSITYSNPDYTSRTLGMAQTSQVQRRLKLPAWVPGLFSSSQGTGRVINETIEYARSSPAGARMQAEASMGKYHLALGEEAASRGLTSDQLNKQIEKELDAVDKKTNSFSNNKAAFDAIADKYGAAGQALKEMRNQVDDLTLDILRQRAQEGGPLSKAEQATYKTLLNNLGRYTHRQYAINSGRIGKKYARQVWDDYQKAKKGDKKANLNNYKKVADAVNYLVDNHLAIPDDVGLAEMSAENVRHLYDTWGRNKDSAGLSLDQMRNELATTRNLITPDKLNTVAEDITKELLQLKDSSSALTSYFRGSKLDNSILKQRTRIPKELRDLMGEITDPSMRLLLTVGKQAEFVARNKMFLELRDMAGPHIQPPEAVGTDAVEGMTKLEGEAWGPLEGYYASKNMRNLIGDTVQQLATFEQAIAMSATRPGVLGNKVLQTAFDKWGNIAGLSKGLQIVYNPMNFLYNFVGAPRMLLSNGNLNPKNTAKALKTSMDLIAYAIRPSTATEEAMRANKYGITDSAFIGEIKSAQYDDLRKLIKEMAGKSPQETLAALKTTAVGAKELYAMMDVWSKLANFYHQVDVLTDFYKKEGIDRTHDQIDREAADNVSRTNITYKRAAPLVKALERGGITQFGTYFYEVFRSEVANAMQGIDEIKRAREATTPEGRNVMALQGARRLSGQVASWALTAYVSQLLAGALGGEDEEENRKLRNLLPEYVANQDFVPMGKNAKGETVLFNFSRIDPIGPITDIMRTAMNMDATPEQLTKQLFDLYVAPRVGTQLLKALMTTATDQKVSRQPTIQQIAPETYSQVLKAADMIPGVDDRTTKAWTNVVETFLPGFLSAYRDTNVRPEATDTNSTLAAAATYLGATMYKLDAPTQAKFAAMDAKDALKNARQKVVEMFKDHPEGLSEAETLQRVVELRQEEKQAFDKLKGVYDGAIASGMKPSEITSLLKNQGVSVEVSRQLHSGKFKSRVIEKKSIDEYKRKELIGKSSKEKKEITEKWDKIWDVLKEVENK